MMTGFESFEPSKWVREVFLTQAPVPEEHPRVARKSMVPQTAPQFASIAFVIALASSPTLPAVYVRNSGEMVSKLPCVQPAGKDGRRTVPAYWSKMTRHLRALPDVDDDSNIEDPDPAF
jgi:hypothetical protein